MSVEERQLPLDFGGSGSSLAYDGAIRREERRTVVQMVEHTPYPRTHVGEGTAVGFTRDLSASGMCLGVGRPETAGSLLHVIVRSLGGRPTLDSIARVTRCASDVRGRFWLGLELLVAVEPRPEEARPHLLSVRPVESESQLALA